MRIPARAFTALIALLTAEAASPAAWAAPQVIRHPWRLGVLNPDPMTRTAVGTLTGDLFPDAVILDGSRAYVLDAPGHHDARAPLDAVVNDVCVVAGAGAAGQDALATVGPDGLAIHSWNASVGDFDVQPLGGPDWTDAPFVLSGPIDTLGHDDLVAFSGNWRTVRQLVHDGNGWSPRPEFTIPERPHEAYLADWEGDGQLDLVVLSGPTLWGFGLDGSLKGSLYEPSDRGTLAVLREAGGAKDFLAWATYDAIAGTSELLLLDRGVEFQRISLGALDVAGLVAADEDLDGDRDLLVVSRTDRRLRRYLNVSKVGTPLLSTDAPRIIQLESGSLAAPTARMGPVSADFDQDGDPDFFVMLEDAAASFVVLNSTQDGGLISATIEDPTKSFIENDTLVMLYVLPTVLPTWVSHLRVTAWRRDGLGELVPLGAHTIVDAPVGRGVATAPIPLSRLTLGEVYSLEARLVGLDPSGTELRTGPAVVGAFSLDETTYESIAATEGHTVIFIEDSVDSVLGRETGGYVPKDSVDPFEDGVPVN